MRAIAPLALALLITTSAFGQNALLKGSAEAAIAEDNARIRGQEAAQAKENAARPKPVSSVPLPSEGQTKAIRYIRELDAGNPSDSLDSPPTVGAIGYYDAILKVTQVIDGQNFLAWSGFGKRGGQVCWFRGWDTSKMVDGQEIMLDGLIVATESKTYNTASGATSTVLLFRPIDAESVREAGTDWREWKSTDGKFSIVAAMTGFKGGKALLITKKGRELAVSTGDISKEDRKYIHEWLTANREAGK